MLKFFNRGRNPNKTTKRYMQGNIFYQISPPKEPLFLASLDKLVQVPTEVGIIDNNTPNKLKSRKSLSIRAGRKYHTNQILGPLLYYAKENNKPLHNHYQKVWYCNTELDQINNTLKSHYCNSRACHTCNRIRTAKQINHYLPLLEKSVKNGKKIAFATLTIPNVSEFELESSIKLMKKQLSLIQRVLKEKRGFSNLGIIHLECTVNSYTRMFHPHFHILSDNYEYNEALIKEWLIRFPTANKKAQDNRYADYKTALKELFKYSTKIIETNKKTKENNKIAHVNIWALDIILTALFKKRTIIAFGMKQISEDVENLVIQEYSDLPPTKGDLKERVIWDYDNHKEKIVMVYDWIKEIKWIWKENDWFYEGIALSDYKPPPKEKFSFRFHY
jgi:hypothetical protein